MTQTRSLELLRQSYGLIQTLLVLALLIVVMATLSPRFLSWINLSNLMGQMAVPLVVAAGMTVVMISGEFDISVGSVVALTAAVSAALMHQIGIPSRTVLAVTWRWMLKVQYKDSGARVASRPFQ